MQQTGGATVFLLSIFISFMYLYSIVSELKKELLKKYFKEMTQKITFFGWKNIFNLKEKA